VGGGEEGCVQELELRQPWRWWEEGGGGDWSERGAQ
jgi:hypothetical protein